jgi:hypothetical protein
VPKIHLNKIRTLLFIPLALLAYALLWLIQNPIHPHQTVHAGGLTMQVPLLWQPVTPSQKTLPIALRRGTGTSGGTVTVMDAALADPTAAPWTVDRARAYQSRLYALENKDPDFNHLQTLSLPAGSHPAFCVEGIMNQTYQSLICYLVGTTLQFNYGGSLKHEPAARQMLASLQ